MTTPKLTLKDDTNLRTWIDALETTTMPQIRGAFKRYDGCDEILDNKVIGCCALGLMDQVLGYDIETEFGYRYSVPFKLEGIPTYFENGCVNDHPLVEVEQQVIRMNDEQDKSFKEIAAYLREVFDIPSTEPTHERVQDAGITLETDDTDDSCLWSAYNAEQNGQE